MILAGYANLPVLIFIKSMAKSLSTPFFPLSCSFNCVFMPQRRPSFSPSPSTSNFFLPLPNLNQSQPFFSGFSVASFWPALVSLFPLYFVLRCLMCSNFLSFSISSSNFFSALVRMQQKVPQQHQTTRMATNTVLMNTPDV